MVAGEKKIRVFIAISLPDEIRQSLKNIQDRLKKEGLDASFPNSKAFHLTVKFIGDVAPDETRQIITSMENAAEKIRDPLVLNTAALGVFPSIKNARVLWSGIGGRTDILQELAVFLNSDLQHRLGLKADKKKYTPHLTLARFKKKVKPEKLVTLIRHFSDCRSNDFQVSHIQLLKSDLKPSGAVHTPIRKIFF